MRWTRPPNTRKSALPVTAFWLTSVQLCEERGAGMLVSMLTLARMSWISVHESFIMSYAHASPSVDGDMPPVKPWPP